MSEIVSVPRKYRGSSPVKKNLKMDVSGSRNVHNPSANATNVPRVTSQPLSYSKVAQKEICPTRNQAIILDSIDGLTIRDYALAIGGIIGPSNMISISRISQNRICIYSKSEEKADEL